MAYETPPPPEGKGRVKVASFNVLNYFTTLDNDGPICGPSGDMDCRGADSETEFARQQAKIASALADLDADIVGLIELENNAYASLDNLVEALNDRLGANVYSYVDTGTIGTDAIKTGFIYKLATVAPAGLPAILDSGVDPLFLDQKNRPALAQTFDIALAPGKAGRRYDERLTVVVNHLKSKGSPCDDVGDPDTGDQQGNCAGTRADAAQAIVDWLATDPTGSGDPDVMIIGDLNSYAREDTLKVLEGAGYVDMVIDGFGQGDPHKSSYVFYGESGTLDYALASPGLAAKATGAAIWQVNSVEPAFLDYNENYKSPELISELTTDAFRSSDHDPVIVGLARVDDPDGDGVIGSGSGIGTGGGDKCPYSTTTTYVVLDGCNSGVANPISANGCSLTDDILGLAGKNPKSEPFGARLDNFLANLVGDGKISLDDEAAIRSCVAASDLAS